MTDDYMTYGTLTWSEARSLPAARGRRGRRRARRGAGGSAGAHAHRVEVFPLGDLLSPLLLLLLSSLLRR